MEIDPELQRLVRRWSPPPPSPDLDDRMMARFRSARGWRGGLRRLLHARLSVPLPLVAAGLLVAVCLLLMSLRNPGSPGARMAGFEPVASPQWTVVRAEVTQ